MQTKLDPDSCLKTLDYLHPTFSKKLQNLESRLQAKDVDVKIGATLIGPKMQGRLWCAGVSSEMVEMQRTLMERAGAPKLAAYLRDEWCGLFETRSQHLPGASWHNHGQAANVYVHVPWDADQRICAEALPRPIASAIRTVPREERSRLVEGHREADG